MSDRAYYPQIDRSNTFKDLPMSICKTRSCSNEQIEDTAYSVYDINAADKSYEMTAYVSLLSSNIERIDLMGKKDGLDLLSIYTGTDRTYINLNCQ